MGWFDEDDDDDDGDGDDDGDDDDDDKNDDKNEEEEKRKAKAVDAITAITATSAAIASNQDDGDSDDPLDAYMKALEQSQQQPLASRNTRRAERLDVDNEEEEGNSHWKERIAERQRGDNVDDQDDPTSSTAAYAAQQALSSTFHKAGSKLTNVSIQLDAINHDQVQYNTFHKVFLDRTETPLGHVWRQQQSVTCTPIPFDPITTFSNIDALMGHDLLNSIRSNGYTTPTPVQAQTLSVALGGRDALVTASTGSGKTLAYVWPMIIHINQQQNHSSNLHHHSINGPVGLVLVPTREIALQVQKQIKSMTPSSSSSFSSIAITGGVNRYQLVQDWKKSKPPSKIVVATPGRLLDVLSIKKNGLSLHNVTFVVLDECDRMLDMGFESQVKELLNQVRPNRQSLLLSATLGRKIELVAQQWLVDPIRIAIGQTGRASDHVHQHVMVLPDVEAKKSWLHQMVPILGDLGRTLVFVATRVDCERLAQDIIKEQAKSTIQDLTIATLHGDLHATDRRDALRAFTKGQVQVLIATDVAARGLDVHVMTVICFDPAKNLDIHVHRIGRAGRLAKEEQDYREGTAYILLTKKDADFAHVLMNSFERDQREISPELRRLAQTSRRSGNDSSTNPRDKSKWNKTGIGFVEHVSSAGSTSRYGPASSRHAVDETNGGAYHGFTSSSSSQRERDSPAKRSRWN